MIQKIDHAVITVENADRCMDFYQKLGFEAKRTENRYELYAGDFKINVHVRGRELSPHALHVQPGSADLCFEYDGDLGELKRKLLSEGICIEEGIVQRTGVRGKMQSLYVRDPDGNLLEFSCYR